MPPNRLASESPCPSCEYDLRGHADDPAQCPECGVSSTRAERVIAAMRKKYLHDSPNVLADFGGVALFLGALMGGLGVFLSGPIVLAVCLIPWFGLTLLAVVRARMDSHECTKLIKRQLLFSLSLAVNGAVGFLLPAAVICTGWLTRALPMERRAAAIVGFVASVIAAIGLGWVLLSVGRWLSNKSLRL